MKNRYDKKIRENNKNILNLCSAVMVLRHILAEEIKKEATRKKGLRIIELGCGEGDSILPIIEKCPTLRIEALDVSPEMIGVAQASLKIHANNIAFICDDALTYLKKQEKPYDIITSSWTLHNFSWDEKRAFLKEIFLRLRNGGKFMLMDKVYPDDKNEQQNLLERQNKRYEKYLPKEVSKEIIKHEHQDYEKKFVMIESPFIQELKKIGFKNIKIIDRVERDVVLIAEK